jgi:hypothetical protein
MNTPDADEVLDDEDVFQLIVEKGFQPTSEDALAAAGDDGEGRGCSDRHRRLIARSLGDSGAEPFHGGQELLDVVSFSPAFGERGAGKKSIAPCAELAVHMPASKLTDRLSQVRFPHHGLRISAGHALAVLACRARLMRTDRDGGDGGDGGGQGPMGGARGVLGRHPSRQRLRKRWPSRQQSWPDRSVPGRAAGLRPHFVTAVTILQTDQRNGFAAEAPPQAG